MRVIPWLLWEITIRTAAFATVGGVPALRAPSTAPRRAHLQDTLPAVVGLLHRRRADLVGDALIGDYVALDWLEWNGGALRLTVVGENICAQVRANADGGEQQP